MDVPLTLVPRLPPPTLVDIEIAAGTQQQQDLVCIPSGFGTNPLLELEGASHSLSDLPLGWTEHTHPKGRNHYAHADNRLVTHVNPRSANNLQLLESAFAELIARLPPTTQERYTHIVLNFTEEQLRERLVEYYLVDYPNKQILWVLPEDADRVGLPPYPNVACLRSMLRPHFWNHVNHFPSTAALDIEAATIGLRNVLNVGRVSGDYSSTPWTSEDCNIFLKGLQASLDGPPHYTTAIIGQLNTGLTGYEHGLRWGARNNRQLWFPRGGANHPIARVFRRRGDVAARLRFPWWTPLLTIFLLLSAYLTRKGMFIVREESANPAIFIHTFAGSVLVLLSTPVLNTLGCLDRRIPIILARSPRLSLFFVLLASSDIAVYGLFVDEANRLLVDGSPTDSRMSQVLLKLILPPMLISLTLIWRYRDPRLYPT
ncbi:hypothetical protein FS837_007060 [Tulasnella sp. UAMH 9824]|nr:hypothetical protein FS837_007060 [Tulasnella sp. UAMH 9824]